jgi:cytochrome P450
MPVTIGDTTIPAGARCLLLLGAANRDGRVFAEPDTFDPHRPNNREHVSFGAGPHYCVGAALARLEAWRALARLTARMPDLRLVPEHARAFKPNLGFRAHVSLTGFASGSEAKPAAARRSGGVPV